MITNILKMNQLNQRSMYLKYAVFGRFSPMEERRAARTSREVTAPMNLLLKSAISIKSVMYASSQRRNDWKNVVMIGWV